MREFFPGGIKVKAVFQPQCKWRPVEEFGPHCFEEQADGSLIKIAVLIKAENGQMTNRNKRG